MKATRPGISVWRDEDHRPPQENAQDAGLLKMLNITVVVANRVGASAVKSKIRAASRANIPILSKNHKLVHALIPYRFNFKPRSKRQDPFLIEFLHSRMPICRPLVQNRDRSDRL